MVDLFVPWIWDAVKGRAHWPRSTRYILAQTRIKGQIQELFTFFLLTTGRFSVCRVHLTRDCRIAIDVVKPLSESTVQTPPKKKKSEARCHHEGWGPRMTETLWAHINISPNKPNEREEITVIIAWELKGNRQLVNSCNFRGSLREWEH